MLFLLCLNSRLSKKVGFRLRNTAPVKMNYIM